MRGFQKITIAMLVACTLACVGSGATETLQQETQPLSQSAPQEPAGPSMVPVDLEANPTLPEDVSEQLYYGGLGGGPGSCYWLGDVDLPDVPANQARYLSILDGAFDVCFWDYTGTYDLTNSSASMRLPDDSIVEMAPELSQTFDGASELRYMYSLGSSWQEGVYTLAGDIEGETWQYAFIPVKGFAFDTFQPNERVRLLFFRDETMPAVFLGEIFTEANDEGVVLVENNPDYSDVVIIAVGATSGQYYFRAAYVTAGMQEMPFGGTPFIDELNPLETVEFARP
jgi:hypothetical protein